MHNFNAGPCVLPREAVESAIEAIRNFDNTGIGLLEISHRTPGWERIMAETEQLWRELLNIPEEYEVLFLGGGASTQFFHVPANLLNKKAAYLQTGVWAKKAAKEAKFYGDVEIVASSEDKNYTYIPKDYVIPTDADYFHITTNNTIYGTEIRTDMDCPINLVADMSSDILSRPVDVSKFSMIYGGVQKNLGPAGATFIIMKKSMLERRNENLTAYMDYELHSKNKGLYNTPPVFSIWGVKLVLDWVEKNGGAEGMLERAKKKSSLIYDVIDSSSFFHSPVDKRYRSRMNIVFRLPSEELEKKFIAESSAEGMLGLKGHRSVGGLRASLYNALPYEDVVALRDFMVEFERKNG